MFKKHIKIRIVNKIVTYIFDSKHNCNKKTKLEHEKTNWDTKTKLIQKQQIVTKHKNRHTSVTPRV